MREHDAAAYARASVEHGAPAYATDGRTDGLTQKHSLCEVISSNASPAGEHKESAFSPREAMTERQVLDLLAQQYDETIAGARRFAVAEHPDAGGRIADLIAVDAWARTNYAVHGHEVKLTRSDWLNELREPSKAETWARYCDRWWLVVSDETIVRNDLPADWGLLAVNEYGGLVELVRAKKRTPEPMPRDVVSRLMRAVARTTLRSAGHGPDCHPNTRRTA